MMAAIQMNNEKGQVTRLFSSPVTSAERETCQDDGKVNDASMHVHALSSEKCDTASKNGENGVDVATEEDGEEAEEVRRRSSSVLEAKERAHNFLRDELQKAQQELKLKDRECQKLHQVQEKMGEELEELTASLFEEANKMVQDANIRRMQAEKLLKEANAKIDVLQAEVTALKTLVITSTPSMPNKHLHPQLEPKKDEFVKGHRRSTSHHNFSKEMRVKEVTFLQETPQQALKPQRELDPVCFEEFRCWKVMPTMAQSCVFLSHIISEDVLPCLGFANRELARSVFECVMDNSLTIEPVPEKHPSAGLPQSADDPSCKCALVNSNCACKYRIKLDDSEEWHFISQLARNRITAVCDFMTYIRYITQGLVKSDVRDMYWEIVRLRQQMALARLGLS